MIAFAVVLLVSLAAFFVIYNYLSSGFEETRRRIREDHRNVMEKLARLGAEKKSLAEELDSLETKIKRVQKGLAASPPGSQTAPVPGKEESSSDKDERMGDYLLRNGLITMEQHEKALSMMEKMQLDLAAVCLTLGFIDTKTAQKAHKETR